MSTLFDQLATPVVIDPTKDYLTELVGEGKKFKSNNELALGKVHSDAHIETLEKTLAAMREELTTRKTAEELINQIALARTPPADLSRNDQIVTDQNTDQVKSLTTEDVDRMFAEREANARRQANLTQATQKLKETYGDNAASVLQQKATELGVAPAYLQKMAEDSPNVFTSLFQAMPAQRDNLFQAPPQSTFRQAPETYTGPKYSEFNKVKQDNPTLYWSAKFQRSIMEAADKAMAAGEQAYEKFKTS